MLNIKRLKVEENIKEKQPYFTQLSKKYAFGCYVWCSRMCFIWFICYDRLKP